MTPGRNFRLPPTTRSPDDQIVLPPAPPGTHPEPFVDHLDVNEATADDLAHLPAMTLDRARRAIDARAAGFPTVDAFAEAAGLSPDELDRIRGLLACHPAHADPAPEPPPPYGRIVDA